jgi:hypothetical protein
VTGARRRPPSTVVARPVVAVLVLGLLCMSLGNLIALGCVLAWLRAIPGDVHGPVVMFLAAAAGQFLGGIAALLAWSWSR